MLMVYGPLMPIRVLEEVRFWKMQEREHTVVIRTLVPDLEPLYVRLLQEWEGVFEQAELAAVRLIEAAVRGGMSLGPAQQAQVSQLLAASSTQSQQFVQHLMRMEQESVPISTRPIVKTVLEHIMRESEYFLGVLEAGDPLLGAYAPEVPGGISPPIQPYEPRGIASGLDAAAAAADGKEQVYLHVQPKTASSKATIGNGFSPSPRR